MANRFATAIARGQFHVADSWCLLSGDFTDSFNSIASQLNYPQLDSGPDKDGRRLNVSAQVVPRTIRELVRGQHHVLLELTNEGDSLVATWKTIATPRGVVVNDQPSIR